MTNKHRFISLIYSYTEKRLFVSLFLTLFCILCSVLCSVLLPILLKLIIDKLTLAPKLNTITVIFFLYAFVMIMERFFSEYQFITYAKWENDIIKNAFSSVFNSLFLNKPAFFIENMHGAITGKIYQAISGLDSFMFDFFLKIVPMFIGFILIISSITIIFDFKMSLIIAIGMVTYTYCMITFNNKLIKHQNDIRDTRIHAQGITTDLVNAWKDIKLTNSYAFSTSLLNKSIKSLVDKSNAFYMKRGKYGFIQSLPICGIFIAANYQAILSYTEGYATIGSIVLINSYLFQLLKPLESFSIIFRSLTKNYSDFIAIFSVVECEKENLSSSEETRDIHAIVLKNFKIDGILHDVNMSINKGEKIAIMGISGSGKTTLLNAISGLKTNYSGDILINGHILEKANLGVLRNNISYMNSDARLIHETVENNLSFGGKKDILSALNFLNMDEKILSLPKSIDSIINESTTLLSAGENQRLKIARTMLLARNMEIYDEATSALNQELEETIVDYLLSKNEKTIIFVTHKKNLIKKFDKVYCLHEGRLIPYQDIKENFQC